MADLDLADLVDFLSRTGATGRLAFGDPGSGVVHFVGGYVVLGLAEPIARLDTVFLNSGILDNASWETVRRSLSSRSLLKALDDVGISADTTRSIVRQHALAALALPTSSTPFSFESNAPCDIDTGVVLSTQELSASLRGAKAALASSLRTIGEWKAVPHLTPALPPQFDAVTISRHEWRLVTAVDGCKTASELCAATGLDHVTLASALARLIDLSMVCIQARGL